LAADKLRLIIEDNGKPFDVVSAESHGVNQTLDEMQVGGLGIHLVKSLASKTTYQRTSFGNKVTVEFKCQRVQEPSRL
jgi:anti-sigma regulatory factor (Ser/Thr protein kinase)